jgi:hypothetical protein
VRVKSTEDGNRIDFSIFHHASVGVGESEEIGGGIKLFDEIPRIPQTQ